MLSRPHPVHGWMYLQPADWRACLQKQIEERDRLDDPQHSGPAPEFLRWVAEVQLPQLARHPHYQQQIEAHITELELKLANMQKQIDGGRLDLRPAAGQLSREIRELNELLAAGVVA